MSKPSAIHNASTSALRSAGELPRWLIRYLRLNGLRPMPFPLSLMIEAGELGYFKWPRQCARWIRRAHLLDVGCGRGFYSVGFLFSGAQSYTGLDPTLDLDGIEVKDSRSLHSRFIASRWTPRELMRRVRGVQLFQSDIGRFDPGRRFDAVVMNNVTEHLMEIEAAFAKIHTLLRPGGYLIFRHPNYYSWGGHHMRPRDPSEIVPGDAEQAKYMDWAHVRPRSDWPATISKRQNRIRLIDLFHLTSTLFRIESWQERQLLPEEGASRFSDEIRARYPELTVQDFLTKYVLCAAQRRSDAPCATHSLPGAEWGRALPKIRAEAKAI